MPLNHILKNGKIYMLYIFYHSFKRKRAAEGSEVFNYIPHAGTSSYPPSVLPPRLCPDPGLPVSSALCLQNVSGLVRAFLLCPSPKNSSSPHTYHGGKPTNRIISKD